MQTRLLGRSRGVVFDRTRSDATQLPDSTRRGGRSRLVVRRPRQDERLPGTHIGTGLYFDRGEQRRENVRRGVALFQDAADAAALDGAGPGSMIDLRDCNG